MYSFTFRNVHTLTKIAVDRYSAVHIYNLQTYSNIFIKLTIKINLGDKFSLNKKKINFDK